MQHEYLHDMEQKGPTFVFHAPFELHNNLFASEVIEEGLGIDWDVLQAQVES